MNNIITIKERYPSNQIMVGFNRRFSSLSKILKSKVGSGPITMIYRINAGNIPSDTWIQDSEIGGGRIIGVACHFIDYLNWLNGSLPISVYASALPSSENTNDNVYININLKNGSTGVVAYYSNGPKSMPKEYIEVFYNGIYATINNFKELYIYGKTKKSLFNIDKGQDEMVKQFFNSVIDGKTLIPFEEVIAVTNSTFAVVESLKIGLTIKLY